MSFEDDSGAGGFAAGGRVVAPSAPRGLVKEDEGGGFVE